MKLKFLSLVLLMIFISGCGWNFWEKEEEVFVPPPEEIIEEEEFEPNELFLGAEDSATAVCGPSTLIVEEIFQDDFQLKVRMRANGDIREISPLNAIMVGSQIEITNNNGKYCRYKVQGVTKKGITLIKVE
ncbi:MAG: hypothetical protein GF349_04930 [Candidatus Magasanikbacteria bacterium]|nr:hypothetical protein [Candidatus Magasanikbacteria bacterium]